MRWRKSEVDWTFKAFGIIILINLVIHFFASTQARLWIIGVYCFLYVLQYKWVGWSGISCSLVLSVIVSVMLNESLYTGTYVFIVILALFHFYYVRKMQKEK